MERSNSVVRNEIANAENACQIQVENPLSKQDTTKKCEMKPFRPGDFGSIGIRDDTIH